MATILCPNPQCKTKSSVADALLGKKVRCKICNTPFVASALPGESVTASPPQGAGPGPKLKTAAGTVSATPAAPVAVVVRHVTGASAGGSTFWCMAALLAFVLPIAAAGTFVALNWQSESSNDSGGPPRSTQRLGAIEIGSKGVKYMVFEVFPDASLEYDYRILEKDSSATNLVSSLKVTGHFDPKALQTTAGVVGKFWRLLQEKPALSPERVLIVGSAGLFEALEDRRDERAGLVAKNKQDLRDAVGKEVPGRGVYFIDVEQEVKHQLRSWVPVKHRDEAVTIDVGSGGTRGGYEDGGLVRTFTLPGIQSLGEQLKAQRQGREPLVETAKRLAPSALGNPLAQDVRLKPGLRGAKRVYLGGGVVWVLATCQHPGKRDGPHVTLKVQDFEAFADRLRKDPEFLKTFSPPADLDETKREAVAKDVAKMHKIFFPEQLLAGAEILRALAAELELERKELAWYRASDNAVLLSFVAETIGYRN